MNARAVSPPGVWRQPKSFQSTRGISVIAQLITKLVRFATDQSVSTGLSERLVKNHNEAASSARYKWRIIRTGKRRESSSALDSPVRFTDARIGAYKPRDRHQWHRSLGFVCC